MRKTVGELCYILGSDLPMIMAQFLKKELKKLNRDWWQQCVLNQLLGEQRHNFLQRGFENIDQMDLTLLVQVFERNWGELSRSCNIKRTERSYINEIKAFRDVLAHTPLHLIPRSDVTRALDTIKRFVCKLVPDDPLILKIDELLKIDTSAGPEVLPEASALYHCPIPNCDRIFKDTRGGWDSHVASLKMHPNWYPNETERANRLKLFKLEFIDWFETK